MRFARAVLNRPYKFTIILLVANIFVFLLMWQLSEMPFSLTRPLPHGLLVPFGAKVNSLIETERQWWRFVTPMFLHVNALHLMVNMYSLWILGPYVEKLYGSAKFVVFWVSTGVAGVVASYLTVVPGASVGPIAAFIIKTNDEPSAGASGALFGLVGVLFVFGIKYRHELPEGFKRAFGTGLLPMILMNLFIGYVMRGFIDNAAHVGGLVSGAILALVVDYRRPGERSGIAITWRVLQIAAIVLVAVCFFKVVQQMNRDQLLHEQRARFNSYARAMTEAQETFYPVLNEQDVSQVEGRVQALDSAPPLDPRANVLRGQLKALLLRAKALHAPAENATKTAVDDFRKQRSDLIADYVVWGEEYNTWLKTTGSTYGAYR